MVVNSKKLVIIKLSNRPNFEKYLLATDNNTDFSHMVCCLSLF